MTATHASPVVSVPLVHRVSAPCDAPPPRAARQLLLATGGRPDSDGAVRATALLASRHGASVRVVTVFSPRVGYPAMDGGQAPPILPSDQPAADAQLAAVRRQVAACAPHAAWPIDLRVGHLGPRIAEAAAAVEADLVIIGGGRPRAADRPLGDRGAIAVAACVDVPLLAVAASTGPAPQRVMFAIGLDECSLRAVDAAVAMLPEPEAALIAHARLHPPGTADGDAPDDDAARVAARVADVRAILALWRSARVDVVLLTGDPLQALLALARHRAVDLVVGGLHGASWVERSHARNLTLRLLAESECSVLLMPRAPAPRPAS